jgi:MoxR-like ATPase
MTTKQIPASWPQQKAIWSICRRVCEGNAMDYKVCQFEHIKAKTDSGDLTRKKASDIIGAFYDMDPAAFVQGVLESLDGAFVVNKAKFEAAERRRRAHKKERYEYEQKDERQAEEDPEEEQEAAPKGRPPAMPAPGKGEYQPWGEEPPPTSDEFTKKLRELERMAQEMAEREKARKEAEAKAKAEEEERKRKEEEEAKKFQCKTPGYVKPDIFDDVCLMMKHGTQVCLVGPSGCGKSMMISEIAKVLERDLYTESFAGGKRYAQVFGGTHLLAGESKWLPAEFLKQLQKPGIVFMDEIMSADADVLIGCNSILDIKTRKFYTPDGPLEVHPECTIVGASNVTGREYNPNYKGTQQQDASVLNRFVQVPMAYDQVVEENICRASKLKADVWRKLLDRIHKLRSAININNIMYDPSTRKLVQAITLINLGMDAKKAFSYVFMTPLSKIELKKIGDIA